MKPECRKSQLVEAKKVGLLKLKAYLRKRVEEKGAVTKLRESI